VRPCRAFRELRELRLRLALRFRCGCYRLGHSILQSKDGARELVKRNRGRGSREDGHGVLKGGLLPERYEHEAKEREERHQGFGDAASRNAEHLGIVPAVSRKPEITG
jgi:hypothetical protein